MEPMASLPSSTIEWRISSRSSMLKPAAVWRLRNCSLSKMRGSSPGDDGFQFDDVLRPFLVRVFARQLVLDRAIFVEAAFFEIERDHLARSHAALADDAAFVEHDHARF